MQNDAGSVYDRSQHGAEMQFDSILKKDNELLCGDRLPQGFVSRADGRSDVVQQQLDFAHDKCSAGLSDPRAHRGMKEKLIHARYAAEPVLKRFLAHRCILARLAALQARIILVLRLLLSRELMQTMRGCQSATGKVNPWAPGLRKSGSEEASGSRIA